MASGTYNISTGNASISGYVEWYESNVNVSSNTSDITMNVYLHRTNTYSGTPTQLNNVRLTRTFYINGETITSTEAVTMVIPNDKSYVLVASTTKTGISHNSDGSLSIYIAFAMSNSRNNAGFTVSKQGDTIYMSTIPRTSVLNSVSINLTNKTLTWSITRYSSDFTDDLVIYSGNKTVRISSMATYGTMTLNDSQLNTLYEIIGTATSATANAYVDTYNSNTFIGSSNVLAVPMYLPEYALLWQTTLYEDSVNSYDTYKVNSSDLIAYLSQPKLTVAAVSSTGSNYGMTIRYYVNNVNIISPVILENYTGQVITVRASDGRTIKDITWVPTNNIINYKLPSIQCTITRLSPTSDKANVVIKGSYYDGNGLTNLKTLGLVLTYTERGSEAVTIDTFEITETQEGDMISFTATATLEDLNYQKDISYAVSMTDLVGISPTDIKGTIPRGRPAWNAYYDTAGDSNFNVYGFYKRNEDCFFPIGFVYISLSEESPATYFGGNWERVAEGRTLLGCGAPVANTDNYFGAMSGSFYNAGLGSLGGQDYHVLTQDEMPEHNHYINNRLIYCEKGDNEYWTVPWDAGDVTPPTTTNKTGGSQRHNNMPPYLAVYIWERVS